MPDTLAPFTHLFLWFIITRMNHFSFSGKLKRSRAKQAVSIQNRYSQANLLRLAFLVGRCIE